MQERLGGVAGIAFVVLFVASTFVGASELSGPDQTADTIARDLAENRQDGLKTSAALAALSLKPH